MFLLVCFDTFNVYNILCALCSQHLKPSKAMPDDSAKPYYHASDIPNTPAEHSPAQDSARFGISRYDTELLWYIL